MCYSATYFDTGWTKQYSAFIWLQGGNSKRARQFTLRVQLSQLTKGRVWVEYGGLFYWNTTLTQYWAPWMVARQRWSVHENSEVFSFRKMYFLQKNYRTAYLTVTMSLLATHSLTARPARRPAAHTTITFTALAGHSSAERKITDRLLIESLVLSNDSLD